MLGDGLVSDTLPDRRRRRLPASRWPSKWRQAFPGCALCEHWKASSANVEGRKRFGSTMDRNPYGSSAHGCEQRRILLRFIDPGKPMQNGHIESFNGRFRDECLNANWFVTLRNARQTIGRWRRDYNRQRPHSSLAYRTPNEFAGMFLQARMNGVMIEKLQ